MVGAVIDPPRDERELEDRLSTPSPQDIEAARRLDGDVLVLGAGGKMGPTLTRLVQRACAEARVPWRVIAVSRYRARGVRDGLEAAGVHTVACDLLDPAALAELPDAPNVILLAGQKFGTAADPESTWALNAFLPGLLGQRYRRARTVVFSTGNVYPLADVATRGSRETDPVGPQGEYAQSALARERIATFFARRYDTPLAILRFNYAVELRYGVLHDLVARVAAGAPIDLTMGYVNVLWQRDANSVALRSLDACQIPPLVLNVTGAERLAVRQVAETIGLRLGRSPTFVGTEAPTALLSDAGRCWARFGAPAVDAATALEWAIAWHGQRGPSLGKPTRFEERGGEF